MEDETGAKGLATIQLATGAIRSAELHWYEAHGIGRKAEDQALPRLTV
jgi:hypothetical protein